MMLEIPLRSDALPEYADYRDTGCDLHDRCLTCPFERCRYEVQMNTQRARARARKVRELRAAGMSIDEIAANVGLSRRQVFRDLKGVAAGATSKMATCEVRVIAKVSNEVRNFA